jgi:hypothetical protein
VVLVPLLRMVEGGGMTEVERPDWLKPGAEVVIWTEDNYRRQLRGVTTTTVTKVWAETFTVAAGTDTFEIHGLMTKSTAANGFRLAFCAPAGSDEARAVLENLRHQNLSWAARKAVETWDKKRTRENRMAAITALQAVEVDEEES